jgi:hypothetical protein
LTTVISNVPGKVLEQPAGADPEGEIAELTPPGIGVAKTAPAATKRAKVRCILTVFLEYVRNL